MGRLVPKLTGIVAGLAMVVAPWALQPASAAGSDAVIALSNAYYGNAWRHRMAESFE